MNPKIRYVGCAETETAYFTDDQAAIREGGSRDGFLYEADARTPGLRAVREPGRALTILLALDDGQIVSGDCAAVQYSGVAGRGEPVDAEAGRRLAEEVFAPLLPDLEADGFRAACAAIDAADLPLWFRYGASQALARAHAAAAGLSVAELITREWDLPAPTRPVPVFAQSGENPRGSLDRMILKRVDALPHGLVNNVETCLGREGELLADLVGWARERMLHLAPGDAYRPTLHFDTYGTIGEAFGDLDRIVEYLIYLESLADPYPLRIEHPIDAGGRDEQIEALGALLRVLRERGARTEIVADEWCNTLADIRAFAAAGCVDMIHIKTPDLGGVDQSIEAVFACHTNEVQAYVGGTCNETVGSAQVCAELALACAADLLLAKPGMGVDEGLSVVRNQMRIVLAGQAWRAAAGSSPR